MEWDDLRYVLAVQRAGSVAAAARALGVSNVTVFRRLETIEQKLGARLFERKRQGYVATAAALEIVEQAARIDEQVRDLEARVSRHDRQVRGTVRLTTVDTWGALLLPPLIAKLGRLHPALHVNLNVNSELLSIARHEADIALRSTDAPPENLVGHRLGPIRYSVYAAKSLAGRRRTRLDLARVPWVGLQPVPAGHLNSITQWIRRNGYQPRIGFSSNSVLELAMAVRAGVGVGIISNVLADALGGVVAVSPEISELNRDIWLLVHPDLREVTRVATVYAFLRGELGALLTQRGARR